MSIATLFPPLLSLTSSHPHLCSHAPHRTQPLHHPMTTTVLRQLTHRHNYLLHHHCHRCRRFLSAAAAAVRQDTTVWTHAPLTSIRPAAESLFHISVDVSDSPDLANSFTTAGQYLQLRVPTDDDVSKPSFLAIASPPSLASVQGVFEFLVKSFAGSTAELLCGLNKGDVVELSQAMGIGFDIDQISPPEDYQSVLIFATGSGIRYFFKKNLSNRQVVSLVCI